MKSEKFLLVFTLPGALSDSLKKRALDYSHVSARRGFNYSMRSPVLPFLLVLIFSPWSSPSSSDNDKSLSTSWIICKDEWLTGSITLEATWRSSIPFWLIPYVLIVFPFRTTCWYPREPLLSNVVHPCVWIIYEKTNAKFPENITWTESAKYIQQGKQRSIEKEALPGASGNS